MTAQYTAYSAQLPHQNQTKQTAKVLATDITHLF